MDLVGIVIAFIMLMSPARIFHKILRNPQGRLKAQEKVDIMFSSACWPLYVKHHGDKFLVINIMQICYMILFILFTGACLSVLKNRFKHGVIVLVELFSVCILARLALAFRDPVKFGRTVSTTGTTFISLMSVLCGATGPPFSGFSLFGKGVMWSIAGLISEDVFIFISNLIGGLLGLVLLVAYAIRYRRNGREPDLQFISRFLVKVQGST